MRALLIVNPHATSTTRLRRDVIARALASAVELEIVETRYRGHGTSLAAMAAAEKYDLVITLGGDGTVNETVNGLLADHDPESAGPGTAGMASTRPALAPLPGGSANVFVRALGLAADPVDAAGQVLDALAAGRRRSIGLGRAAGRYFTFNAGLGIDAEVVRAVEGRRAHGRAVTPALYMRMATRQFYRLTDRRTPVVRITAMRTTDSRPSAEPGTNAESGNHQVSLSETSALDAVHAPAPETGAPETGLADSREPLFWCTVSNTSPWTYVGPRAVQTNPAASFDTGLDVFGLRRLGTISTASVLRQMLAAGRDRPPAGRSVVTGHDLAEVTLKADRPVAFQIDGEYMGEREHVCFQAVPGALLVVM